MLNNYENTLIGATASSVLSSSAIQSLIPHIKEILDDPKISFSEEYRERYLAGYMKGFLWGYFQAKLEVAGRMKEYHWDKDFIAKGTELSLVIIDQLPLQE